MAGKTKTEGDSEQKQHKLEMNKWNLGTTCGTHATKIKEKGDEKIPHHECETEVHLKTHGV